MREEQPEKKQVASSQRRDEDTRRAAAIYSSLPPLPTSRPISPTTDIASLEFRDKKKQRNRSSISLFSLLLPDIEDDSSDDESISSPEELFGSLKLRYEDSKDSKSSLKTISNGLKRSYGKLELLSLGAIAWRGMQEPQRILDAALFKDALSLVSTDYPDEGWLEPKFARALKLGFIRHESKTTMPDCCSWFNHLLCQEYFAAYYVLQVLQRQQEEGQGYQKMHDWLARHKYEPRYAVFLDFLAELTALPNYTRAMDVFWSALLSPPRDVVGAQHTKLIVRCLIKAKFDPQIPEIEEILAEIRQWVDGILWEYRKFEQQILGWRYDERYHARREATNREVEWFTALFEKEPHLLVRCNWKMPKKFDYLDTEPLGKLGLGLAFHSDALKKMLQHNPYLVEKILTEWAPSLIAHLEPQIIKAVRDWYLQSSRDAPMTTLLISILNYLGKGLDSHPEALKLVLEMAVNRDRVIKLMALHLLGGLGEKLGSYREALDIVLQAAGAKNESIRVFGIKALCSLGTSLTSYPRAFKIVSAAEKYYEYGPGYEWVKSVAAISGLYVGELRRNLFRYPQALQNDEKNSIRRSKAVNDERYAVSKKTARTILVEPVPTDILILIKLYLRVEEQRQQQRVWKREDNGWLSIVLKRIEQIWPALTFDGRKLMVVSDNQSDSLPASPALVRPLFKEIKKVWASRGWPVVSFKSYLNVPPEETQIEPPLDLALSSHQESKYPTSTMLAKHGQFKKASLPPTGQTKPYSASFP